MRKVVGERVCLGWVGRVRGQYCVVEKGKTETERGMRCVYKKGNAFPLISSHGHPFTHIHSLLHMIYSLTHSRSLFHSLSLTNTPNHPSTHSFLTSTHLLPLHTCSHTYHVMTLSLLLLLPYLLSLTPSTLALLHSLIYSLTALWLHLWQRQHTWSWDNTQNISRNINKTTIDSQLRHRAWLAAPATIVGPRVFLTHP